MIMELTIQSWIEWGKLMTHYITSKCSRAKAQYVLTVYLIFDIYFRKQMLSVILSCVYLSLNASTSMSWKLVNMPSQKSKWNIKILLLQVCFKWLLRRDWFKDCILSGGFKLKKLSVKNITHQLSSNKHLQLLFVRNP